MTQAPPDAVGSPLDEATHALVRLAALAAGGTEIQVRIALADCLRRTPWTWVEELVLQTYLFAGFPRTLNAAREWRRLVGEGPRDEAAGNTPDEWEQLGERTCAIVYGASYEPLRRNIRALHPALDRWMIVEGYGKVLSRPALDLPRRELCIVAACAVTSQERQLHSHLHGALNAGAPSASVNDTLDAIGEFLTPDAATATRLLWARVRSKHA